MADTCKMTVNVFGGNRRLIPAGTEVLLTVRDGNQKDYQLPNNGYFQVATVTIDGIPFFDNFGDQYAVVAWVNGFQQAGFHPVTINPKVHSVVDIMLAKTNAQYDFSQAGWPQLKQNYPSYAALLSAGVPDDTSAASRYQSLLTNRGDVLACYFNLLTAMSQIHLPVQTPLFYLKELIWGDDTMKQDRFFAWADPVILDQMVRAEQAGMFAPEMGASLFHDGPPGAGNRSSSARPTCS